MTTPRRRASTSPEPDEPSPTPSPSSPVRMVEPTPGFLAPPPPTRRPDPPPTPSPSRDDDDAGGLDWPELAPPPTTPMSSSLASIREPSDPKAYVRLIGAGLKLVTRMVNRMLAPPGSDAWRPDPDELDAITEPLSRIAARHSPATGIDGDVGDSIETAVAVTGYAVASMERAAADREQLLARAGYDPVEDPAP